MASTGTALFPSTTTFPNTDVYPGQGFYPTLWCLYAREDVGYEPPTWLDASSKVLSFSISRGRESELTEVDAGTATITLDDRANTWNPSYDVAIRPLNRWWLRAQFSGETHDLFYGYAERYTHTWDQPLGTITTVNCADAMKVLALEALPTTNPPRDTYVDVVMFDDPAAFWPMDNNALEMIAAATVGEQLVAVNGAVSSTGTASVVGEPQGAYMGTSSTYYFETPELQNGQSGDAGGLAEFTVEFLFSIQSGLPASSEVLMRGPLSSGAITWRISLNSTGAIIGEIRNSGGTTDSVASSDVITNDGTWFHIVMTLISGNIRLYINAVEHDVDAHTGTCGALDAGQKMTVGNLGTDISTRQRQFDNIAFYRKGLAADRVTAHYEAARQRGFARMQLPHVRAEAVLDSISTNLVRRIRTGTRTMTGAYMRGQSPLEELRQARLAESPDGLLFIAKDGALVFLDNDHRSASPWDTSQLTIEDITVAAQGAYDNVDIDYSDSFLVNSWVVTRYNGTAEITSDSGSVNSYFKRSGSLLDLPITDDGDVGQIAFDLTVKYSEPDTRITAVRMRGVDADTTAGALAREIGDRVTVEVNSFDPGAGATSYFVFIQKIAISGGVDPWQITWNVSPL